MMVFKAKRARTTVAVLACIAITLGAMFYFKNEAQIAALKLDRPWPEGQNSRETDQNMEKYFLAQLNNFKNNFPKGADIEALKTAAKDEGYYFSDDCYKAVIKEIPRGGGCVNIGKNYMGRSIMQSYDVLYDENQKIFLIKMGHRLYRDK